MYVHDVGWFIGSLMERGGTHKHTVEGVHTTHNKKSHLCRRPFIICLSKQVY